MRYNKEFGVIDLEVYTTENNEVMLAIDADGDISINKQMSKEELKEMIDTLTKIYQSLPVVKATRFAKEKVENLCDLLLEAPIEDFKYFFEINQHSSKEIGYDLGIIQGYMEALGIAGSSLGEKLDEIIDIMHDSFNRS